MGRVDGIHFPTGQDMSTGLLDVLEPDSTTIMNEPEARWHYAAMRARFPDALVIWRASPDKKPADLGWDANEYSREIFRSLDFHADRNYGEYPTDVLLLNELNLDYERGEDHHDGGAWDTHPDNWPSLYRGLSTFLQYLLVACRERFRDRGVNPRIWFPAWAPSHGEREPEIRALWEPVAQMFDGVCFHAYGASEGIQDAISWYAEWFPNKPLNLGEWNTDGLEEMYRIPEEVWIRGMLQDAGQVHPNLSACYFIWAWAQDDQRKSYDIDGNPERLAVWTQHPDIPDTGPEPPTEEPLVPPGHPTPRGIDIASYQGYPDWSQVRADGIEFAFIKATEGTNYVNPTFASGWSQAPSYGVLPGTYHFARPDLNGPEAEASFFWKTIQEVGVRPGDVFALDLEDYEGSLSKASIAIHEWTLRFLRHFTSLSDTRPLLYINPGVINQYGFARYPEFAEYGLWLAEWTSVMPLAPAPWEFIAVWQSGDNAHVNGIAGLVDEDYYNGPIETFPHYGYGYTPPVDPPVEPPVDPPVQPSLEEKLAGLETKIGYVTGTVADAFQKEIDTMQASLNAMQAALDELRRQA